ncbi:MAG TPA: tRNA lysidine(34) synthetase TilS [Usitatibacteraceae bacterium]|nr:tRNA lysidine(34) synthetase TilS [Usitatibacteraceae bacterium]
MPPRPVLPEGLTARLRRRLAAHVRRGQSVCVAYSGGLDSTVLLDLLARLRAETGFTLSALHVHHGISRNADRWAEACAAFAHARGVPLVIARVTVDRDHPAGLEAAARASRYAAFARAGTDFVALAHHRDDQAETVLLQALRGTGMKGLSAMPEARAADGSVWIRPLIDEPRDVLLAHAREAGLDWVEDESNELTAFDRNFLRHEIMPALERRFPQYRESLARLARHAATASGLLEELAREDTARITDRDGLSAAGLGSLDAARRANVLRHFLAGHGLAMPGEARLADMSRQLVSARDDARILLLHGGRALVRHQGRIVIEEAPGEAAGWDVAWHGERVFSLGEGRGEVRFADAAGEGIAVERVGGEGWHFAPRAGGERIRLHDGAPTRTLKNLLQERAVPVWRRSRLPLLFEGDRLVWVPGIGIAAGYRAKGTAAGLIPDWLSGTVPENRPRNLSRTPAAPSPGAPPCDKMKS